jgi:hypothetical protein
MRLNNMRIAARGGHGRRIEKAMSGHVSGPPSICFGFARIMQRREHFGK